MVKLVVLAAAAAGICLSAAANAASTDATDAVVHRYLGPAVSIGAGSARIVVLADAADHPTALGIELTAGVLERLPEHPNGQDKALDWHYYLWFPKGAPSTGFDHVLIDWHPEGHPPQGIYTLPHFDFHFYLINVKEQRAIRFPHPETTDMTGVTMPMPALIAPGYFIPPGTQVDRMGVHAVAKAAPEFHGHRFTYTFIYGYTKGTLAFLEPMVTTAYLGTRPKVTAAVAVPGTVSYTAYYPGRYSVVYDAKRQVYDVMLEQLQLHQGQRTAGAK